MKLKNKVVFDLSRITSPYPAKSPTEPSIWFITRAIILQYKLHGRTFNVIGRDELQLSELSKRPL